MNPSIWQRIYEGQFKVSSDVGRPNAYNYFRPRKVRKKKEHPLPTDAPRFLAGCIENVHRFGSALLQAIPKPSSSRIARKAIGVNKDDQTNK